MAYHQKRNRIRREKKCEISKPHRQKHGYRNGEEKSKSMKTPSEERNQKKTSKQKSPRKAIIKEELAKK